ncbi:ATP-binding protein [Streptomyces cinereoruber]|uniref:ATP-binding protein n=1 Tax=Streptomyces cinereoruber TaxID=67260 RepID=UPI003664D017
MTINTFVGRRREFQKLDECAELVLANRPCVTIVTGSSGIGKTALIRNWLASSKARGMTVVRASCDASETDLPFGVINQLANSMPKDLIEQFHRIAEYNPTAVPFHVGMDLLAAIDALQSTGPVTLVVDDAQWADPASLQALSFVVRRLQVDAVMIILIARSDKSLNVDIERLLRECDYSYNLELSGLTEGEVAELAEQLKAPLNSRDTQRLHAYTAGSPLHAATLLNQFDDNGATGTAELLAVPTSLAHAAERGLAQLPDAGRQLVEALAVLDSRQPLALVCQLARLDDATVALEAALADGWLRWWPDEAATPIAMHHALQRDAAYRTIPPSRRRDLHSAAADLVDPDASWHHRVAAAQHTDEKLASTLEEEATKAVLTISPDRFATLLLWASDLSEFRSEKERRLLIAAAHLQQHFNFARVAQHLAEIEACYPSPVRDVVLGTQAMMHGRVSVAEKLLKGALSASSPASETAVLANLGLGQLYTWYGRGRDAINTAERALQFDNLPEWPSVAAVYHQCSGELYLKGPKAGLDCLERSSILPEQPMQASSGGTFMLTQRSLWRMMEWDFEAAIKDAKAAEKKFPEGNTVILEDVTHYVVSASQYFLGNWEDSAINSEYAIIAADAERKVWSYAPMRMPAAFIAASRGDWNEAEVLIKNLKEIVESYGPPQYAVYSATAEAVLGQAQADPGRIMRALGPLLEFPVTGWIMGYRNWWLPLLSEGLIGTNRFVEAASRLSELRDLTRTTPKLRSIHARLAGQLAEAKGASNSARRQYEDALSTPADYDLPMHRAALEHSWAKFLTRHGQRAQATIWFHKAIDRYSALGARPYIEGCKASLAAVGEVRHNTTRLDMIGNLTDRERSIAHLIGRGLTNKEIATKLFISVKTVEYHLGNTYTKLGITNRRHLRDLAQNYI